MKEGSDTYNIITVPRSCTPLSRAQHLAPENEPQCLEQDDSTRTVYLVDVVPVLRSWTESRQGEEGDQFRRGGRQGPSMFWQAWVPQPLRKGLWEIEQIHDHRHLPSLICSRPWRARGPLQFLPPPSSSPSSPTSSRRGATTAQLGGH